MILSVQHQDACRLNEETLAHGSAIYLQLHIGIFIETTQQSGLYREPYEKYYSKSTKWIFQDSRFLTYTTTLEESTVPTNPGFCWTTKAGQTMLSMLL
jgi:hypothetical protein